ncbi:unnamed protein product [Notodromas monacha]|uniref:Dipeptidyl peptidase 3 n=1 Tax=Notodromas monacha TaxID=399045 RepID=A0A7R9BFX1_9CRUS|nr:unnamed protein product [Notodromas monacha]CAG0914713.1 unnamed protein product [Notodromas monacha]
MLLSRVFGRLARIRKLHVNCPVVLEHCAGVKLAHRGCLCGQFTVRNRLVCSLPAVNMVNPHVLEKATKVIQLDAKTAFDALDAKQQLYSHHISRASWLGGLIVLHQTSPEAPLIFVTLHRAFASQTFQELADAVKAAGISDEDFHAIELYMAGFYANMGNYKGFGDIKFVPEVSVEVMEKFIKASKAYKQDPKGMDELWGLIKGPLFCLKKGVEFLGFNGKGVTTYFSSNCTEEDSKLVGRFMTSKNMGMYINRVFKTMQDNKPVYEIRFPSAKSDPFPKKIDEEFEGSRFVVTRGDYDELLQLVADELKKAADHAGNDNEKNMLLKYSESFEDGSLDAHYDGSRFWIKNKSPAVETYIGFIETYRDPAGVRGEFEGFVAMVNKEMSVKFSALVENAETLLNHMPWPKEFEKDKFLKPDFTSLDVLTFSGSGIPSGINIPNYDEIRQYEGFKNVSLGNVIFASSKVIAGDISFLNDDDAKLVEKYGVQSFEQLQVGLHELLGHGSGKLFVKDTSGGFNFDKNNLVNPLTGSKITSWYEPGESYDSKFGALGSAYEECRAETTCLQLSHIPEVLRIFGYEGEEAEVMKRVSWLTMVYSGFAKALESYQPSTKAWLQAHSQARYVILRVLLEAGQDLITVEEVTGSDGKPDLRLQVDYSKIDSVGRPAVAAFLRKLQVYKSCGDIAAAKEMFMNYSEVPDEGKFPFGKWREILMARKKPRRLLVCANTSVEGGKVQLKSYDGDVVGMIQSFVDRYPLSSNDGQDLTQVVHKLWQKDQIHFPLLADDA